MQAPEALGILHQAGHGLDGQGGGVARHHAIPGNHRAKLLIDLLLDLQVFEYRFHHDVHVLEFRTVLRGGDDQLQIIVHGALETLLLRHPLQDLPDEGLARLQGRRDVFDHDGHLHVPDDVDDDSPAHGAKAQDRGLLQGPGDKSPGHHRLGLVREGLDEEGVDAPLGFLGHDDGHEVRLFDLQPCRQGNLEAFLDGIQGQHGGGQLPAPGGLEDSLPGQRGDFVNLGKIMLRPLQRRSAGDYLLNERLGRAEQIGVRREEAVHDPQLHRLGRGQHRPFEDQFEGGIADQPGEALGAAAAGKEADVALRQADKSGLPLFGDPGRAGQGELQAAAEAVAVNGRQHRQIQIVQLPERPVEEFENFPHRRRRLDIGDHLEIRPGKEIIRFPGDEDDSFEARRFRQLPHQLVEACKGRLRPGVHGVADNVESHHADAVFHLQLKHFAHKIPPFIMIWLPSRYGKDWWARISLWRILGASGNGLPL